jgi:hypothetical protein
MTRGCGEREEPAPQLGQAAGGVANLEVRSRGAALIFEFDERPA